MKKIFVLLIVILVAYWGYQVYLRNKPNDIPEEPYVLDENYLFYVSFDDNEVSKLINKTYYVYDDTKVILETKYTDRATGKYIETTYKDITISDSSFSANYTLSTLSSKITDEIPGIYRYKLYVKSTNKTVNLMKADKDLEKFLIILGDDSYSGAAYEN